MQIISGVFCCWVVLQYYRGVILSDLCISSLHVGLLHTTSLTWPAYMRFIEERSFVLYVSINSLHVHRFQATKCFIDRKRIRRTHLLTVEKVEEIDAKLETPARKTLDRQAQLTGLLIYIISTNCNKTAAF